MKLSEIVLGGAAVLLGAAVYLNSMSFPPMDGGWPGPSLFPQILAVLLAIFGGVVVVQAFRPHGGEMESYEPATVLKAGLVLVAVAAYIVLVQGLGFFVTASFITAGLMLLLGVRLRMALPASIAVALFCVLLFEKILRVPLPLGILGG